MTDALNSRVARFQTNESNVDSWVKGDAQATVDFGGGPVRSPAKLIADKDAEINQSAAGVLASATAQATTATNQAGIATTRASAASASADAAAASASAAALAGKVYADTTTGLANTTNGQYFSVPVSNAQDSLILYQNVSGVATEKTRYPSSALDALSINRGKAYPLRSMTRAGTTSAAMTQWNNLILKVSVRGAEAGKYYRIGYQTNEAAVGSGSPFSWTLTEHSAADFATTDAGYVVIQNYTNPAPSIDRNGGIQTITIAPVQRPNLRFDITIDAAQLPASGGSIDSNSSNSRPAWSWIIDPSCYVQSAPASSITVDSMSINSGKVYPLKAATRGGVTSNANAAMNALVLGVKIINGDATKVYRVAYQQNGATLSGVVAYDWIVEEYDAATYSTAPVRTILMSYDDSVYGAQQQISPTGGIQTVRLYPPARPNMRIEITCDASQLPAAGTTVDAYSASTKDGYSYIVDPSCVDLPRSTGLQAGAWNYEGLYWTYSTANGGTLIVIFRSGSWLYQIEFGPKGPNSIPDTRRVLRAALGDPSIAAWTTIVDNASGGDWAGPLIFSAVNNGDGSTSKNYTGGNHAADGNSSGGPSARNVSFIVLADGAPVTADASAGVAATIKLIAVNEIFAYNTVSLGRYVVRETVRFDLFPGIVGVKKHVQALEDVLMLQDNGPQTFTVGFQAGTFIYYGANNARTAFTSVTNSGTKSANPNVWAIVFQDAGNGQLGAWMDRAFGIGDGRYVKSTWPYIRGGGASNTKFYHAAIVDDAGIPLAAGASYEWRGGWAWQQAASVSANLDSVMTVNQGDERVVATCRTTGETIAV
ncbi:hypothetical protein [Paraburkholderia lycopersici]|uniref:Uncharacterized protein n=1 Tax=Paraburkholderia lycopersici TaxID=416944 RepID=A0A1G7CTH0_9BURK|nr:hypothetical protein [Paraburkholderia lycopersici]SDE41785.1 hypothetical protein SAMN05421548_14728 [Paraburkholderia lycopersici]